MANPYSRVVRGLKVTLPIVALGLLATLFLFTDPPDPDRALPYAEVDVDQLARDLRVTQPRFAGVLEDGRELTLIAERATPEFDQQGEGQAVVFEEVRGRVALSQDNTLEITSGRGRLDVPEQVAYLSGTVEAQSTAGFRLTSDALSLFLSTLRLVSDSPIRIEGPGVSMTAGAMTLSEDGTRQLLSFNGGVRLIYQAQQ